MATRLWSVQTGPTACGQCTVQQVCRPLRGFCQSQALRSSYQDGWWTRPTVQQLHKRGACCRLATVTDQGSSSSSSDRDVLEFLAAKGIDVIPLQSATRRNPALPSTSVELRVAPILNYLLTERSLDIKQVELMLVKCPQLFSVDLHHKVLPAVAFLGQQPPSGLGLQPQEVDAVLRRFPHVLLYGVKAHLVPQLHYLMSLGVPAADLPALVLARPQVLGSSIELVVTYLRRRMGIKRHNVGRLLRTFPIDFSIRHVVVPALDQEEEEQQQQQEKEEEEGLDGSEGSSV